MTQRGPKLAYQDFSKTPPRGILYSESPRLTLREAFEEIARNTPREGKITFINLKPGISVNMHPRDGSDNIHLAYRYYPNHQSIEIRRIESGNQPRSGLGTGMINTQYPFWRRLGVTSIFALAHDMSEGFYQKIGFEKSTFPPERDDQDFGFLIPMRLDLNNLEKRNVFHEALSKPRKLLL